MSKQIEELLKPRYKVIADWPGNVLPIGTIYKHETIGILNPKKCDDFPHLFKRLQWWEDREKFFWSDHKPTTPLFVSNIAKTFFGTAWGIDIAGHFRLEVLGEKTTAHLSNYLPATSAQYDNYQHSKPQTI